ncbi:peptidoglycan recognition protein family protein [Caldisalinibacter kiritimatiensis]|uniref:Putative peptidoglycan recoqnition protein n=1 Tax=Caldisalinibacter kiritimatiensis TaxID=1304284 RepID=R1CYI9_9FIRM|nr:peptidoglycan recognition family protein [Caldisalinibacter kiritimatiensis]EOD01644.1 putative peptidoglycan recoqnition protein [Caldisalinibacter kiritimatiensis]
MGDVYAQPKPYILSRSGWGALPADGCSGSNNPEYIIIHHTGDENDALANYFGDDEEGFMKRIQEIHMNDNGWCDIGYNYAVGVNGLLMEGRNVNVAGAHAYGYNSKSIGVVVLGNYDIRDFTVKQEDKLVDLLAWLCYKYTIDYNTHIIGHRDVASKSCPGDNIYNRLSTIKDKIKNRFDIV